MLTRLKVSGFKNLIDVDVRFGPFTCIAGANGVGKSNLFDAISFLSALADHPLTDAALSVRDEGGRSTDVRSLFHRVGDRYASEMTFEAEMVVPYEGQDDLGQIAQASITFLQYSLTLAYRLDENVRSLGTLELMKEELSHINLGDAHDKLLFPHSNRWRKSAIRGRRTSPFISTESAEEEVSNRVIKLHQDSGGGGRTLRRLAVNLPRTVLSTANAAESPTALLARREMQSWRLLQLEPSSLRRPDEFTAPFRLGADGSHLAATLYHLGQMNNNDKGARHTSDQVYHRLANRLAELIDDVRKVWVDRDERRELLTLQVTGRDGTSYPARALSDGTLRFLALAVLDLDPSAEGLLCFEEPENGIHPERIPAMLRLLRDIATDADEPVGSDNPLRQVIINTHSPAVVGQVPEDSLLMADLQEAVREEQTFKCASFSWLPGTWRDKVPQSERNGVSRGKLMAYLNPATPELAVQEKKDLFTEKRTPDWNHRKTRRVIDRPDLQMLIPFPSMTQSG